MSGEFARKVAFITGAGSGFGLATALAFANRGAGVVLADIREDRVEGAARQVGATGARALPIVLDIGDREAADDAFARVRSEFGRLDIMVNNAGYFAMPTPVVDITDEAWSREVSVTLNGTFAMASRAARFLVEQGEGGRILFTASISSVGASRGAAGYCACKAGIVALAGVMALELAPYGITVNSVSPGPADTQRSVDFLGEEIMGRLRREFPHAPLNRLASADDVANAFVFLASAGASYITGQNLLVDGGMSTQIYEAPRE